DRQTRRGGEGERGRSKQTVPPGLLVSWSPPLLVCLPLASAYDLDGADPPVQVDQTYKGQRSQHEARLVNRRLRRTNHLVAQAEIPDQVGVIPQIDEPHARVVMESIDQCDGQEPKEKKQRRP